MGEGMNIWASGVDFWKKASFLTLSGAELRRRVLRSEVDDKRMSEPIVRVSLYALPAVKYRDRRGGSRVDVICKATPP